MDPRALAPRRRTRRTHRHQQPPRPPRPLADTTHRRRTTALQPAPSDQHRRRRATHPPRTRRRTRTNRPHPPPSPPRPTARRRRHPDPATPRRTNQHARQPDRIAVIDNHLGNLHQRRQPIADEHALTKVQAQLRRWGAPRPQHLVDAITRRSTHLAHHALANDEEWVNAVVRTAHRRHGHDKPEASYRLLVEIAAYRERAGVTGPDPLGTPPADDTLAPSWHHLNLRLAPEATTVGPSPIGR